MLPRIHRSYGPVLTAVLALAASAAPALAAAGPVPVTTRLVATADTAVFAGGCFWGVEGVFDHVNGVLSAESGYAGGSAASPSYEVVSTGTTGHAESVRVIYDPSVVSYEQLLQVFFTVAHDPTELNRQGPDYGTQYRSIAFYRNAAQKQAIEAYIAALGRAKLFHRPIVTQVEPLRGFYPAEAYHQDFLEHHPDAPYIVINDAPKLVHLKKQYPALWRERGDA
jgi:peptide-methionine (S)-S-oxide reductase